MLSRKQLKPGTMEISHISKKSMGDFNFDQSLMEVSLTSNKRSNQTPTPELAPEIEGLVTYNNEAHK